MKNPLKLTMLLAVAAPLMAFGQAMSIDRYASKGYAQSTYFWSSTSNAMFTVQENSLKNGSQSAGIAVYGHAMMNLGNNHFAFFMVRDGDGTGWLSKMNPSLKGIGQAEAMIPVTRVEYVGFMQISREDGWLKANSTLSNVEVIERTKDQSQYDYSIPGLGLLFKMSEIMSGKLGINPMGTGAMSFFDMDGNEEVIFAPETKVHSASWVGYLHEHETTIIRN